MIDTTGFFKSLAVAAVLICAPVMAASSDTSQPTSDDAVAVAASEPGSLLSAQAQSPAAELKHAGQRYLISYRSRGAHDEPIVASGYVLLPKGQPPEKGWPVLVWAHGTTGVADTCAPSGDYPGGPLHGYQTLVSGALDHWLARDYAVVAPDYQGLGTPGGHPYMDAASQLHTVVDAMRAGHRLRPGELSPDWLVMGHSQGGAAALKVAADGQADAPRLHLRGAVALAPGGYGYADIAKYALDHPHLSPGVAAFFPIVLLGASAADPAINADQLATPGMQPLLTQARSRCLSELREEIDQSPDRVFRKDADLKPLLSYLKQQALENMSPSVPVLFIQGEQDQLVDPRGTRADYQQLCKAGKTVFYHAIPDGSHRDALRQSPQLTQDFLATLDGGHQLQSCAGEDSHAASGQTP